MYNTLIRYTKPRDPILLTEIPHMPNTDSLNRTVFISDNLPFLQSLDSASIDLVVIDPPFGKRQPFIGRLKPPLSQNERRRERALLDEWGVYDAASAYELGVEYPDQSGEAALFREMWQFERVLEEDWWRRIADTPVWWLIESTRRTHSDSAAAYIAFMARRLLEIRRVLKSTGSVYLHCDHDANAYLRQLMDAVFGQQQFRAELIWHRSAENLSRKKWRRASETILYYSKTSKWTWNQQYETLDREQMERDYRFEDEKGRYTTTSCTNNADRPNMVYEFHGNVRQWRYKKETMERYEAAGLLVFNKDGIPRRKKYLSESPGKGLTNVWSDINVLASNATERTGYPTQKPQALARRIIEASSNPGDIVLDCFAGCAYVPVAAEQTGRRWIACDMSPRAWTVVRRQFAKQPDLAMTVEGEEGEYEGASPRFEGKGVLKVRGPNRLPQRSARDAAAEHLPLRANLAEIRFRQKPLESGNQIWQAFVDEWGTDCWYCGRTQEKNRRVLQLDHVAPNKGDGSNDDCWNRALACVICNGAKSDNLTPAQTIDKAFEDGFIQTKARRAEISAAFSVRREWARKRWEALPKVKRLAVD